VAFGDSLTAGEGVDGNETYPALLAGRLGCRVINCGVSGELTAGGRRRLPAVLQEYRPDLVVLCHGGNDLLQRVDAREIAANLGSMIAMIKSRGADVLLVGVPEPRLIIKTAPFYRQLAKEYRIPCEARILEEVLSSPSLKGDPIHPNGKGNERLAGALADLIQRSQAR